MRLLEHWFGTSSGKPKRHADDLALYYFTACPYCRRVRRACKRLGVEVMLRNVRRDPAAHAELVAGGGRPMVPCLHIHTDASDEWMYESRTIIHYLRIRFSGN